MHKWSSLVCTLFLLVICLSGLPLVFNDEIENWLDDSLPYASAPASTPKPSLDHLAALSRSLYPGEVIVAMTMDSDEPKANVFMATSWTAFSQNRKAAHRITFDARTALVLKQSKSFEDEGLTLMGLMLRLHKDLFVGLAGELCFGLMAALFVIAIVSGIAIYGPFTRKLAFGTVRSHRSAPIRWLDIHNLLGITTLAWGLVVGGTGIINQMTTPLFALWQQTDVKSAFQPLRSQAPPMESELSSPQGAYDTASAALPGARVTSIIFPGASFGSPYHYVVWTRGQEPLTSRLFTPVLIDARNGALDRVIAMPWYLRVLQVSRPLHFGDYGGLPLKILWVALDLVTIAILLTGIYLWQARGRSQPD